MSKRYFQGKSREVQYERKTDELALELGDKVLEIQKLNEKINKIKKIQCSTEDINRWNGLEIAISILENRTPKLKNKNNQGFWWRIRKWIAKLL